MYNFTLDPAATSENAKCKKYYTTKENGLLQNWSDDIVFCNPPYGREIGKWVKKGSESTNTVVMLLPARTDTRWFHQYIYNKATITFVKGRLKFGGHKNSAPFPSMIVVWNDIEVED
jgi:site-specific DNA-methyltransferase (adenine-specific)